VSLGLSITIAGWTTDLHLSNLQTVSPSLHATFSFIFKFSNHLSARFVLRQLLAYLPLSSVKSLYFSDVNISPHLQRDDHIMKLLGLLRSIQALSIVGPITNRLPTALSPPLPLLSFKSSPNPASTSTPSEDQNLLPFPNLRILEVYTRTITHTHPGSRSGKVKHPSSGSFLQELKTTLTRRKQEGTVLDSLTLWGSHGILMSDARSSKALVKVVYLDEDHVR